MRNPDIEAATMKREWPWLREYRDERLLKVAMPLGGIGTGTLSLGGRGDLRDWEIMNHASKGYVPRQGDSWLGPGPSVILHTSNDAGDRQTRLLEGPIDPVQYDGPSAAITTPGRSRAGAASWPGADSATPPYQESFVSTGPGRSSSRPAVRGGPTSWIQE